MIWAVLDTNVLVSGLGWRGSTPARIVDMALGGRFVTVTSAPLLTELERVLGYPRLAAVLPGPDELVRLIAEVAVLVEPAKEVAVVQHDPADNRVLEAAATAQADYVVSGDRHLLEVGEFAGSQIKTPDEFLSLFPD